MGKEVWHYAYPAAPATTDRRCAEYPGPRATPTVDGDCVYTVSLDGHLHGFDAASGKVLWDKKLVDEFQIGPKQWNYGFAGSPLVVGGKLIVHLGAGAAALEKDTGKVVWHWHDKDDDAGGYASPVLFDNAGKPALAILTTSLVTLDPDKGEELWRVNRFQPYDHGLNGAAPVFSDNLVFLSQGNYTRGCGVWRFVAAKPASVWRNEGEAASLLVHFPTPVLRQGYLYGPHNGRLRCVELATGKVAWTADDIRSEKYLSVILAGGRLLVLTDKGELVVVAPDPQACKILARAKVIDGPAWAGPALAGGRLYCRNNKGDLACYDLQKN